MIMHDISFCHLLFLFGVVGALGWNVVMLEGVGRFTACLFMP